MDASPLPNKQVHELRFADLFHTGRGYVFPCDAQGKVNLAVLSERARANYLRACATVGREFSAPVTCILRRRDAGLAGA